MRRAARHAALAAASILVVWLVRQTEPDIAPIHALSLGTAYAGLLCLAVALAVGPWNVLRNRRNPVSGYLRRDVGIWAGVLGGIHTVLGLQVHMGGDMLAYFFFSRHLVPIRYDPFGIANYTGLLAALLLILLVVLSNDRSLRRLGPRRWKSLQRLTYAAAGLVLVHGLIYQVLERRDVVLVLALLLVAAPAAAPQGLSFHRRRGVRGAAGDASA